MKKYVFGIDLGGTTVKLGFFETDGTLLESWEIPTRKEYNGKYILNDIANSIKNEINKREISNLDIEGIGMGVPGPVGEDGTVYKCVNLGWNIFNVSKELEQLTGLKVKCGNDANVAALGEMWQGGGKGFQNLVMVTLGTGIGGGIIINGKILAGSNGAGGEIGHIHINDEETEPCGCGNYGCLEQYASANGISRITKKYIIENNEETILNNIKNITSLEIFNAAKEGDKVALKMIDEVAKILGKSFSNIASVINPQIFVIGGGMSKAGTILIDKIQLYYKKYAFHALRDTEFKIAQLGNTAGIYGGAYMIIQCSD